MFKSFFNKDEIAEAKEPKKVEEKRFSIDRIKKISLIDSKNEDPLSKVFSLF